MCLIVRKAARHQGRKKSRQKFLESAQSRDSSDCSSTVTKAAFSSTLQEPSLPSDTIIQIYNMAARLAHRQFMGVVVSAGKMMKTVKVRVADQEWNNHIKKVLLISPIPGLPHLTLYVVLSVLIQRPLF